MIKTNLEFAEAARKAATEFKTLYVMGCFGAPMNASNKQRYCNNHEYNRKPERQAMIKAASAETFGFDCVCLVKGLLWGWTGDASKTYGGASCAVNGVPDVNADGMITKCKEVSTDFSKIEVGEYLWMSGHAGIYIGGGLAAECTPRWGNKVQITAVHNIGTKAGYNGRKWTKHGKLPYITYVSGGTVTEPPQGKKTIEELAQEVIDGKWSVGAARKQAITAAGYDYATVQGKVNEILNGPAVKPQNEKQDQQQATKKDVKATEPAHKKDARLAGTYRTTTDLYMRNGAGTNKKAMVVIPKGTEVKCYGYYNIADGAKWLYIQVAIDGVLYTGFSHSGYLKK
ncbi:MAG: hypothetical protein IJL07_08960 [Lachnospiraceae bacterium]|nr:hypothetical protein [Lachnospiraceae bacterium]